MWHLAVALQDLQSVLGRKDSSERGVLPQLPTARRPRRQRLHDALDRAVQHLLPLIQPSGPCPRPDTSRILGRFRRATASTATGSCTSAPATAWLNHRLRNWSRVRRWVRVRRVSRSARFTRRCRPVVVKDKSPRSQRSTTCCRELFRILAASPVVSSSSDSAPVMVSCRVDRMASIVLTIATNAIPTHNCCVVYYYASSADNFTAQSERRPDPRGKFPGIAGHAGDPGAHRRQPVRYLHLMARHTAPRPGRRDPLRAG